MLSPTSLALFACYSLAILAPACGQSIPYTIKNIGMVGPPSRNYTGFDEIWGLGVTWEIVQANGADLQFTFSTAVSTVELMQGTSAAASDTVMDVLSMNIFSNTATTVSLRTTLPSGEYHLRVHSIVNTTFTTSIIQDITGRGADFRWMLPTTGVGCGPGLRPDPFVPNTNPSSFYIFKPFGGQVFIPAHSGIDVDWGWKNRGNAGGQRMSSLSLQVINGATGVGIEAPVNIDANGLFNGGTNFDPVALGFPGNTSLKIRATYVNSLPDGGVIGTTSTGSIVAYTSEEFSVVNAGVNCGAINNPTKCSTGVNSATLTMMETFESFVPSPKSDKVTGKITVGYGHVCLQTNCAELPYPLPLSQSNASLLLNSDLVQFTKCINSNTGPRVVLNDNQFGALSSFAFNSGCATYTSSQLLVRLNNGEDPDTVAAEELPKFNKAKAPNGTIITVPGLSNRRAAEVVVFKTPSRIVTNPCV
ncbi:Glycoside hydrolase family 24 protein [Mycena indigotica]|uniref:Glycoside hydrolase family 24 protein n=1 Tax=Mycena indigotica TaxID=2126181 RepID=A0A8H6SG82_9AGAR|nr:Glycoside hydrolase family 24 protein [Mycena indigotica]KAF7297280.1 Glycoside hydrolase family 24 protein [Mycena indigotica]